MTAMKPIEARRGEGITFTGVNLPANREDITILFNGKPVGNATAVSGNRFTYVVPPCEGVCKKAQNCPDRECVDCATCDNCAECKECRVRVGLGQFHVQVKLRSGEILALPEDNDVLTITNDPNSNRPEIISIQPVLSYPDEDGFNVVGEGFSENWCDNSLFLKGQKVDVCWQGDQTCSKTDPNKVQGEVINARELKFSNIPKKFWGPSAVTIGVRRVSEEKKVTLSRVRRSLPRIWAGIGLGVLLLATIILARTGRKSDQIAGQRHSLLTSFLLDKETDTFSLSRFQFYAWTAAAIFGYLFLVLSRRLVQGELDFVDIPSGLPGIVLISASTSVLAQWIQSVKGPKGAGEVQPALSDFIATGGVVTPERFQFFIWTIVGVVWFLVLISLQDPGNIETLPTIPQGFLQLMGISAAGYLGGKLARKPGPVIDEIVPSSSTPGALSLKLRGRNLSSDASLMIGDANLIPDFSPNKPVPMEREEQGSEQSMAKTLAVDIPNPKPEWLKGERVLTLVNPDGQKAMWPFALAPVIDSISPEKAKAGQANSLRIVGSGFKGGATAAVAAPGAANPISAELRFDSSKEVMVTVTLPATPPNTPYKAIVTIKNPDQQTASADIEVA